MPSRRHYLSALGAALAGTAGCLAGDGDELVTPENPQTTRRTTRDRTTAGTPTGDGTPDVSLSDVVVRKAVTYESVMGSGGVLAGHGTQYVVASAEATEDVSMDEFFLVTDGDSWPAGLPDTRGGVNRSVAGHDGGPLGVPIGRGEPSYLAFAVPSPLDAANPRIERSGHDARWPLSADARTRLAAPAPRFELVDLDAPATVTRGDTLAVSLTARNVSETDGRFLAAVYWPTTVADDDESRVVERSVAAGAETTATVEVDTAYTDDSDGPATLEVAGHVATREAVAVRDSTTS